MLVTRGFQAASVLLYMCSCYVVNYSLFLVHLWTYLYIHLYLYISGLALLPLLDLASNVAVPFSTLSSSISPERRHVYFTLLLFIIWAGQTIETAAEQSRKAKRGTRVQSNGARPLDTDCAPNHSLFCFFSFSPSFFFFKE